MKHLKIILLLLVLLPLVSAVEPQFIFEDGKPAELTVLCENTNTSSYCSDTATCNITIRYPNSTILYFNQQMSNRIAEHNYTIPSDNLSVNGEYSVKGICIDGGLSDSFSFTFLVNPAGIRPSDQRTEALTRSIYFIFGISLVLFLAFFFTEKPPIRWTYFAFFFLTFLIGINIVFTSMQDEVVNPRLESFFSGFVTISWYMYWFIGGFLIILWIFTFMNTWLFEKNMRNAKRYGIG